MLIIFFCILEFLICNVPRETLILNYIDVKKCNEYITEIKKLYDMFD